MPILVCFGAGRSPVLRRSSARCAVSPGTWRGCGASKPVSARPGLTTNQLCTFTTTALRNWEQPIPRSGLSFRSARSSPRRQPSFPGSESLCRRLRKHARSGRGGLDRSFRRGARNGGKAVRAITAAAFQNEKEGNQQEETGWTVHEGLRVVGGSNRWRFRRHALSSARG